MAKHKNSYEKLKSEIENSFSKIEDVKHSNLNSLEYLQAFINETLRLYIPFPYNVFFIPYLLNYIYI